MGGLSREGCRGSSPGSPPVPGLPGLGWPFETGSSWRSQAAPSLQSSAVLLRKREGGRQPLKPGQQPPSCAKLGIRAVGPARLRRGGQAPRQRALHLEAPLAGERASGSPNGAGLLAGWVLLSCKGCVGLIPSTSKLLSLVPYPTLLGPVGHAWGNPRASQRVATIVPLGPCRSCPLRRPHFLERPQWCHSNPPLPRPLQRAFPVFLELSHPTHEPASLLPGEVRAPQGKRSQGDHKT